MLRRMLPRFVSARTTSCVLLSSPGTGWGRMKIESYIQGVPCPRGPGFGWLRSAAAAVQPNGLWNIPNLSQPNPGPRGDGSPCTVKPGCKVHGYTGWPWRLRLDFLDFDLGVPPVCHGMDNDSTDFQYPPWYGLSQNLVAWIIEIIQPWLIKQNWPSHVRMGSFW